jgi:hypothetical protein
MTDSWHLKDSPAFEKINIGYAMYVDVIGAFMMIYLLTMHHIVHVWAL